ncbi:uncharacterized protein LOC125556735 [Nematostella vectensis]|uniref:uncharacterized protein LOC125556735 n=1 Tax=Nematostella vectensis TaxID=45351 RepID=UPI002076E000|nr:uncharacterized protein LOC125556735 [Nematostella vectensis]
MVKSFDNALRWRVIFLREKGFTFDEIAETLSVSKRFVYKITRLYRNTRGVNDTRKRKSKARLINANDLLLIRRLIDEHPGLYLDEIQTWLEHFTGCTFSVPSLDRCLKRMGLSVQKMHIVARQRNEFERATYRRFISQFKPNQLLPYSPDLNPIEGCFGTAKKWMLRHRHMAERYPKRCFEMALFNLSSEVCRNYVLDCGYV